ncbi:D-2-hydroxyacid dehydrogenase [Fulvivirga lutimaris]|uniref:D-2-hydroxyacid dehydrogenase n=1 Tax=Fulvivirga lutimaris TaxID=1819566 RepID=UPI0012BCBEE4|nr:D-2-hydroxyacid dehydrogenase [Fulvivirga lutimaris]MTI39086.1 D-2-hydroxyacid dehydrogenase [Fulvivirga lutimaris]
MNIVILDGHTLNPNDLSWEPFKTFGQVTVYDRTPTEKLIGRSKDAEVLLINKIKLGKTELDQLPKLKYIGLCATGTDNVDLLETNNRNIAVTNIPAYGTPSVAQHTFALLLELTNRVGIHNKSVQELEWVRSKDFSYFKKPLVELYDKTIGLIGYGAIGKEVAKIATAFGMNVLIYSRHADSVEHGKLVDLQELFETSDIVSLHTSLTEDTKGLINKALLRKMKNTAFLINTSRGAIINESDLADRLNNNKIAGAALDVLSTEPPSADNPMLTAKNCIITPHISWISKEARQRLIDIAYNNLKAYLNQNSVNRV